MKPRFLKVLAIFFAVIILISGFLLHNRKIWFVYPDKNIYSVDGLDISHHQGEIHWEKVDKKYQFVFIKATEGTDFVDKRFYENAEGVKNTQRILGAYHFFHFNYGGLEQANNYINTVGNIIDLPPVVDFEFTGNPKRFDIQKIHNELVICIDILEEYYGHKVIIYTTKDAYTHFIVNNFNNPIWYRSIVFPLNKKIKNVMFWQYHNSAIIEGIDTKVDLNVFKGDILALKRLIMK
jgi:lysozyme